MTKYELAARIGVHFNTINNWIREATMELNPTEDAAQFTIIPKFMYFQESGETMYFNGSFFEQAQWDIIKTSYDRDKDACGIARYIRESVTARINTKLAKEQAKIDLNIIDSIKDKIEYASERKKATNFSAAEVVYLFRKCEKFKKKGRTTSKIYQLLKYEDDTEASKKFKDEISELLLEYPIGSKQQRYDAKQQTKEKIQDAIDHWYETQYDSHTPHDDRFEKQFERNYDAEGNLTA